MSSVISIIFTRQPGQETMEIKIKSGTIPILYNIGHPGMNKLKLICFMLTKITIMLIFLDILDNYNCKCLQQGKDDTCVRLYAVKA